jgi:uncharacterized small protein (DUF1192 family)
MCDPREDEPHDLDEWRDCVGKYAGCGPRTESNEGDAVNYAEIRDLAMRDLVRDPRRVVYAADADMEAMRGTITSQTNIISRAAERIRELEAERDALKCCGNCGQRGWDAPCNWEDELSEGYGGGDHCHFTPSRWTATRGGQVSIEDNMPKIALVSKLEMAKRIAALEAELAALKAQPEAACASPSGCEIQAEVARLRTVLLSELRITSGVLVNIMDTVSKASAHVESAAKREKGGES